MPIGGTKDGHLYCFHSSCQWGLSKLPKWTNLKWISLESYKWGYIFSFSWRGQPLPYVIYGTTWRYWGYPWQCRRAENWMTLLKAICSKTSYLWILQKFRCIWRKNSNSMHGLKSAILAIFQKLADWLDWPCPVGAALHFRPYKMTRNNCISFYQSSMN